MSKRIFAHKIIYLGNTYQNSVATIEDDKVVDIRDFEAETHSTIFISGTVILQPSLTGIWIIKEE